MGFGRISSGKEKGQNPLFVRDFGLFYPSSDLLVAATTEYCCYFLINKGIGELYFLEYRHKYRHFIV